jgi:hypothetical protein
MRSYESNGSIRKNGTRGLDVGVHRGLAALKYRLDSPRKLGSDQPSLRPQTGHRPAQSTKSSLSAVDLKRVQVGVDAARRDGLQPSLMAIGTLAAFGAASYGLLRNHWERNVVVQDLKERNLKEHQQQRIDRRRKELERLENQRLIQMSVAGVLFALAVLALMYLGWFYLLLAVAITLTLLVCAFS